jgi:two-component system phosphate regulon response regulator PhoB
MKRMTVVMVEDHALVRQLYADGLRAAGYRVVERPGARDLPEVVAAEAAALVVLDLRLAGDGGPDGVEACRRLRRDRRTAALPVIFLTAHATREQAMAAAAAGADRFLAKPLAPAELAAEIAALLAP